MGDMSRSVDLLRQRYETRIKELEAQRGDDVQDMTDDTHRLMPEGHTQNIFDDLCQQQQHDKCIELLNERIEMLEAQVDDYKKERDEWKHRYQQAETQRDEWKRRCEEFQDQACRAQEDLRELGKGCCRGGRQQQHGPLQCFDIILTAICLCQCCCFLTIRPAGWH
uniref:Uncharacterized protein n=1 Tax=Vitrella brassicaformis TaxID=1169539 RepID=A0A7S1JQ79_9ALVE|mmetsp:Transcript_18628/g.44861  ORF Transcript_18628/g.44861 Transcript_18628/m.44861 type:complete len:166 (+) Transcript_18628:102-599(+)